MTTVYYGMKQIHEEEQNDSLAKSVYLKDIDDNRYYIRFYKNRLVNPNDSVINRFNVKDLKWREVTYQAFQSYTKFLQSGLVRYFQYTYRNI